MNEDEFNKRMSEATELANEGDWAGARELFEALDRDIGDALEPTLYGWVYFYLFKSAFMSRDWEAAFELLEAPRRVAAMSVKNGSWVASVGVEVSARVGRLDALIKHGRRCVDLRRDNDDPAGVLMGARTVCAILEMIEEDRLAGEFAELVIDQARALDDAAGAIYGYQSLIRSLSGNPNPLRVDRLIEDRDWLEKTPGAEEIVGFLDSSPLIEQREDERVAAERMWKAASDGDLTSIDAFLAEGVGVNAPWTHGRNSLHAAALAGHLHVARALLERGAKPDIRTIQGRSALHFAAEFGHRDIVELLLESGADASRTDMFGQTAADLARGENHHAILRAFADRGLQ